ncbi:MAG: LacI family DNA-binding transcriptional regulator [Eubacteriales bacterium]|nr:LacI family DNA-binding transcriptional regulator [Eubacteriales bacterium]
MTVRQIAEHFGVAPSTVSVVLNNRPGVRKELRSQIEDVLIKNGYTIKNNSSSTPAKSGNILFIYYKSTDYLAARKDNTMASILSGIEEICHQNNFTFTLTNATPDTLDDILLSVSPENHSGIILLGTEYYQNPSSSFFQTPVPLVVLDGFFPEYPLNTVNMDNSYGVHQAISHLIENGHTEIGYLKSSIEFGCLRDRAACIYSSLTQLGLSHPGCVIEVSQEPMVIQQEVAQYLDSLPSIPSAFVADNDIIAVSAIQVFQKKGFRVPEDISIIGFDDSNICTIVTPYLTTVKANLTEMARLATSRLIAMIQKPSPGFIRSTVGTALVQRESVAACNRTKRVEESHSSVLETHIKPSYQLI